MCGTWFLGDGVWEQDKSLLHSRQDFPLLCHPEGHKWARRFWGLHDSPGLHTLHHTQRETAWKWVVFLCCHLLFNLLPNDGLQLSELGQVNLWMGVGTMSLRRHCITQLSCPSGTLGPQDSPRSHWLWSQVWWGGQREQRDCPLTPSRGNHSTFVAINEFKLEQFYKLAFTNKPLRPWTPLLCSWHWFMIIKTF